MKLAGCRAVLNDLLSELDGQTPVGMYHDRNKNHVFSAGFFRRVFLNEPIEGVNIVTVSSSKGTGFELFALNYLFF